MHHLKTIGLSMAVAILVSSVTFNFLGKIHESKEKKRRMNLVEHSFSTGCYAFAKTYCPTLEDPSECNQMALDSCEVQANAFRQWIEKDRKKK